MSAAAIARAFCRPMSPQPMTLKRSARCDRAVAGTAAGLTGAGGAGPSAGSVRARRRRTRSARGRHDQSRYAAARSRRASLEYSRPISRGSVGAPARSDGSILPSATAPRYSAASSANGSPPVRRASAPSALMCVPTSRSPWRWISASAASRVTPRGEPSSTTVPPRRAAPTAVATASGSPVASMTTAALMPVACSTVTKRSAPGVQRGGLTVARRGDDGHRPGPVQLREPLRERADRAGADDAQRLARDRSRAAHAVARDDREVAERGVLHAHAVRHRGRPGGRDGHDRRVACASDGDEGAGPCWRAGRSHRWRGRPRRRPRAGPHARRAVVRVERPRDR